MSLGDLDRFAGAVDDLDVHAIQIRVIEIPALNVAQPDRERDFIAPGFQRDRRYMSEARYALRVDHRRAQFAIQHAAARQRNTICHRRRFALELRADELSFDAYRPVHAEPHVAHDAAVGPPVVPGVRRAARAEAGNREHAGSVVDGHRDEIARMQMRRDVEGIFACSRLRDHRPRRRSPTRVPCRKWRRNAAARSHPRVVWAARTSRKYQPVPR